MNCASAKPERDKQIVEVLVRRFGPISRAKIHELTGIRPSATSQIVRQLLREGRIVESGVEGRLGRKGVLLRLNEKYRFVAVVEFDDEEVRAGITDLGPRIVHVACEKTVLSDGVEALICQLLRVLHRALAESGIGRTSLIGIGIADPGLVDSRRGVAVTSSTIGFWRNVPLREIFEKEFGLPVLVETRTRAKAVAEHQGEAADGAETIVYVDYGAGIGAGLIVDGRLLYGQGSAAGEFGHTHIVEDGPACNCGSFGCLEAIAGIRAVEARLRRAIRDGGHTDILDRCGGDPSLISGWMVFSSASCGDKISVNIVAEVGRYLGLGIANLINLFNPAVVVIDSSLAAAGQGLLDQITAIVKRQALRESTEHLAVRYARVGKDGSVLGAAAMVIEKHFEIPSFHFPQERV